MELIKKNIHMEHRINRASMQISLEEDVNISDQKPDAFKIICKNSGVRVEGTKPVEGAVWIKGALDYAVLYLTDEKEKRLCSLEGQILFEEKVYTETEIPGDSLCVQVKVEDMTIRLINSRKLNIRSIIGVSIVQNELYDEEIVVDVENPQTCEILKKPLDVTTIALDTRDIYRIREEITVPDGMPNIYSMIWKDVRVDGLNFVPMEGRVGISGELNAFFLYEGEEENTPCSFEVNRAFSGVLDVPDCRENMYLKVDCETEPIHMETKSDYDGEERQIDLDVEMKLSLKMYQNMSLSLVADAYGIQEKMTPVMKECNCECIVKKDAGKIKISDVCEDTEETPGKLQILHTSGYILEEEIIPKEEDVELNGIVHVEVLCSTDIEGDPYRCMALDIPYQHTVSMVGVGAQCSYYGKICMEQVNAVVQGNSVEARVMLAYQLVIYRMVSEPLLVEMRRMEKESPEKALPVMSVYFAREKESIWEVGKKYQVPLATIREINQLSADELGDGQKILIVKEMK